MEEEKSKEEPVMEETKTQKGFFISSKLLMLVGLLVLVLLVAGGAYFLGTRNNAQNSTAVVSPAPVFKETTEAPTAEPTTASKVSLKTFTSQKLKDLAFSGYSLKYPADWTLSEQRDDSVPASTVTLTKDGYVLKIFQAATGGAMCIYEGDIPEGPASDYRTSKYTELSAGFGTVRQTESPSNGKMAYTYCQKNTSDGSWGQPTSVGHMSVTTGVSNPDDATVSQIEQIVKSIEKI